MITNEQIELIKERLIAALNPLAIYIFGSYAWGNPTDNSDLDILIIINKSDDKIYKRPVNAYKALKGMKIRKDILVYTIDEFNNMSNEPSSLMSLIKEKGKILYEAA